MKTLLAIENLQTLLHTGNRPVRAVDGLSLAISAGETFALLGESGCGKSMTALSIMRLLPDVGEIVAGQIKINDIDVLQLPEKEMRKIRGKHISMIFQEPMLSLNPVMTIGRQLIEALKFGAGETRAEARARAVAMLEAVQIRDPERVFRAVQHSWRPDGWGEDGPWMRLFRNARVFVG